VCIQSNTRLKRTGCVVKKMALIQRKQVWAVCDVMQKSYRLRS